MATQLGKDGVVKVKTAAGTLTAVGHIRGWTLDEKVDQLEATSMGDQYKVYRTALKDWSGTLDILFDAEDAGQDIVTVGSALSITVYAEGAAAITGTLTGDIVITGVNTKATYNGLVEASVTYQGTGPVVRT
jgi:predicted secreted protein